MNLKITETVYCAKQKQKANNQENQREMWDKIKYNNLYIMQVSNVRVRKELKNTFKKMRAENYNMTKKNTLIYKYKKINWTSNRINRKRSIT